MPIHRTLRRPSWTAVPEIRRVPGSELGLHDVQSSTPGWPWAILIDGTVRTHKGLGSESPGSLFQLGGKIVAVPRLELTPQYRCSTRTSISTTTASWTLRGGGPINVRASYRIFMVPGMDHCDEGDGPNTFDSIGAIETPVEAGSGCCKPSSSS